MQPYFFPYLGHFALISCCDKWVVFDVTQYTHRSWISRNRVLHPREGWSYISVPLANGSTSIRIADARILSFDKLLRTVLGKLSHYKRRAPFHATVERLVVEVFSVPTESLVELNVRALDVVCRYLSIDFDHTIASDKKLDLREVNHPGGWAPAISRHVGATEYINPIGGSQIFRQNDFDAAGVALKFLDFNGFTYETGPYKFEQGLSILDVMMWNEAPAIREAIAKHSRIIDARDALQIPAPIE